MKNCKEASSSKRWVA